MLKYDTLFGMKDLVVEAIELLQEYEPSEGYYLAFSGGKDSCVIKELANMAKVKYEAHYHNTTVDPPDLYYFIRDCYPDVIRDNPSMTMKQSIIKHKMLPTRLIRFCCKDLKENKGKGKFLITGVRSKESVKRSKQNKIDIDSKWGNVIKPIFDWSENQVWEFIKKYNVPYCKLYDEGFKRLGCIGCPNSSTAEKEMWFSKYPNYKTVYLSAIKTVMDNGGFKNPKWGITPEQILRSWIYGDYQKDVENDLFNC